MILNSKIQSLIKKIELATVQANDNYDQLEFVDNLIVSLLKLLEKSLVLSQNENSKRDILDVNDKDLKDTNLLYPTDDQGYAVAFDPINDEKSFVQTWQRYGMVVGKSILNAKQCEQTIFNIIDRFEIVSEKTCLFDRPETWINMPVDQNNTAFISRGFLEIYHDQLLAEIRQNIRAYIHHVLIWNQTYLWTSFDRIGVKLPEHRESKALPLHVDQNPNVDPHFKTIQGVLALTNCPAERGTFLTVPGSKNLFDEYSMMAKNTGEYVELDLNTQTGLELSKRAQVIPLRAGDLVSWDSRTTHANTENLSSTARIVVYLAAGLAKENDKNAVDARKNAFLSGEGSNVRSALMHASKKPRYTNIQGLANIRKPEQLNLLGKLLYAQKSYKEVIK